MFTCWPKVRAVENKNVWARGAVTRLPVGELTQKTKAGLTGLCPDLSVPLISVPDDFTLFLF